MSAMEEINIHLFYFLLGDSRIFLNLAVKLMKDLRSRQIFLLPVCVRVKKKMR